jgi:hypothetical protein
MNSTTFRGTLQAVSAVALFSLGAAPALAVPLVSGYADPYDSGFVPVPNTPPQYFSAADIVNLTDGNAATGHSFTSHRGEYSSNPESTNGFTVRFDFDVSDYLTIDRIDFLWTGDYTWEGPNFTGLRFGYDPAAVNTMSFFSGAAGPARTVGSAAVAGSSGFDNLTSFLHGDIATLYVSTDLGFTTGPVIPYVMLQTYEVSATVTGTLREGGGGHIGVPEPGTLSLFAAAMGLMAVARRRRQSQP